jgi:uncharacterized protein YgiM (DUF1202 family)
MSSKTKEKLGRVSAEIQAGVDRGYLGALRDSDDPEVWALIEVDKNRKMHISVRNTIEERASYIKRYTKEELEASKGKGW